MTVIEITNDLDNLTPEKLHHFVKEMTASLLQLKDRLHSTDPKVREEAVYSTLGLKDSLEQEMQKLVQKLGIDPAEILQAKPMDPSYQPVQEEIDRLNELFEVKK